MALQVWLPLNGNLHNQGVGKITFISTTPKYRENGRLFQLAIDLSKRVTFTCPNLKNLQDFSVAFWAYVDNVESLAGKTWVDLFGFTDTSSSGSNGTFRFETCYDTSHGIAYYDNTTMALSNYNGRTYTTSKNIWIHCCVVFDNVKHKVYAYRNGIKFATDTHKGGKFNSNGTFYIGETNNIAGMIQDIRIYDHALSNKEVEEIAKGLVLHYKLNNNGLGNPNILTGTYYNSYKSGLSPSTTAKNIDGKWTGGSGGNGSFSVTEDATCPVGKYSWNVLNNTSENRDFQQGDQPYVSGQVYTTSFWAKGSGTCLYRSWNSTDGKLMFSKTWKLTSNWKYYTYTFTASSEMASDSCTFHLGVSGKASINICGMKMEKGSIATSYTVAENENNTISNVIYDSSGYNNNGTIIGSLGIMTPSPRYDCTTQFNGQFSGILIENLQLSNIINTEVTYSFWINPINEQGERSVYFGSYHGISWSIEKTTGNNLRLYWDGSPDEVCSSVYITDGIWQHICITKKGTNDIKVYINGEQKWTSAASHDNLIFPTTYRIGQDADGTLYHGNMSDFRIYATALTENQIKELYNTSMIVEGNTIKPHDLI